MKPADPLQSPIALSLSRLVPRPELFTHASTVHGQAHVARVMLHAFRLVAATGWAEEAPAVVHHCMPEELDRGHPHWRLTSLLKDADGLGRVRLGDLDPQYLRNPAAREGCRIRSGEGGVHVR